MTDRYEKIRKALAMGPTPGPWYLDGEGVRALVRDANGVIVAVRHRMPGHKNETNMRLIAACDPDTIRELLADRDVLARENEAMRRCAIKYLGWLGVTHKPLDAVLREDMADPDMCGDAALNPTTAQENDDV